MSRYMIKAMYLEKPKRLIIWDGFSIYDGPRLKADAYFMFQNDHLIVNTSSSQMITINIYP